MKLWVDAKISPAIAAWINRTFEGIEAKSVRSLGLRDAPDPLIYERAKAENVTGMGKDDDFIDLIQNKGAPPTFIWITCGNTSNAKLKEVLRHALPKAKELLESGEVIVEISDKAG